MISLFILKISKYTCRMLPIRDATAAIPIQTPPKTTPGNAERFSRVLTNNYAGRQVMRETTSTNKLPSCKTPVFTIYLLIHAKIICQFFLQSFHFILENDDISCNSFHLHVSEVFRVFWQQPIFLLKCLAKRYYNYMSSCIMVRT